MKLAEALRVTRESRISIVGAGGKSTALFLLGREIQPPVILTSSTHFSIDQVKSGIHHVVFPKDDVNNKLDKMISTSGPTLITSGEGNGERVNGLDSTSLSKLMEYSKIMNIPLIVEADGSRRKPIKAPGDHEPAIPEWSTDVVIVVGMGVVGRRCNDESVHRVEIFKNITGLAAEEPIEPKHIGKLLIHPEGGLKNIPDRARKIVLLNQCDDVGRQTNAACVYKNIKNTYDVVLAASLENGDNPVMTRMEPTVCIILAGGDSVRFGEPKALAEFHDKSFIDRVISAARGADVKKILVISGGYDELIRNSISVLNIEVVKNNRWSEGQGTSVSCGVKALKEYFGSAIFLLVDQPHVSPWLISALVERKAISACPIILPVFQDHRGNPVLFDRTTFGDLAGLNGVVGGKELINKLQREMVTWSTNEPLLDADTKQDLVLLSEQY